MSHALAEDSGRLVADVASELEERLSLEAGGSASVECRQSSNLTHATATVSRPSATDEGGSVNKRFVEEFQSDEISQQSQPKKLHLAGTCLLTPLKYCYV